jgi:hypothetical protein
MSRVPPFCSQNTEAGLGRLGAEVGLIWLELQDADKMVPISTTSEKRDFRNILTSKSS